MLPEFRGHATHVAVAARHNALTAYVTAGYWSAPPHTDLRNLWPRDSPDDLTALRAVADKYREIGDVVRADRIQDVLTFLCWADDARRWTAAPPLEQVAEETRAVREGHPGATESDTFDRREPAAHPPVIEVDAREGRVAREVTAALAAEPDFFERVADGSWCTPTATAVEPRSPN